MANLTTSETEPTAEFTVSFHVTCASWDEAEDWRKRVVAILDWNRSELALNNKPDSDSGAMCSGHVE